MNTLFRLRCSTVLYTARRCDKITLAITVELAIIKQPKTVPTLRFHDVRGLWWKLNEHHFQNTRISFTYDGRSAIYQACKQTLRPGRSTILLPAFHCPTVVDPVIRAGFEPRFYTIKDDLSIDQADFLSKLDSSVAASLFINYFGFPANISELVVPCRDQGVLLIEDCAHSFLSANPTVLSGGRGDIAIFSFKKTIPSTVGGAVRINRPDLPFRAPLGSIPPRVRVVTYKHLLDQMIDNLEGGSIQRAYHRLEALRIRLKSDPPPPGQETETADVRVVTFDYEFNLPLASARMPWFVKRLLYSADLDAIIEARRTNYQRILETLPADARFTPVFRDLPSDVCPWGFPITATNRSSIDLRLKGLGVPLFSFGETLHSALLQQSRHEKPMLDQARQLADSLLVIAVRQGLTTGCFDQYSRTISNVLAPEREHAG